MKTPKKFLWLCRSQGNGTGAVTIYGDDSPVSAGGDISDSVGTHYVVEAQPLPPAPGTEETSESAATAVPATTSSTSSVPSGDPKTSEPPSIISTVTTSSTTTTTTVAESPLVLQVQVLNGSGVAGATGRSRILPCLVLVPIFSMLAYW